MKDFSIYRVLIIRSASYYYPLFFYWFSHIFLWSESKSNSIFRESFIEIWSSRISSLRLRTHLHHWWVITIEPYAFTSSPSTPYHSFVYLHMHTCLCIWYFERSSLYLSFPGADWFWTVKALRYRRQTHSQRSATHIHTAHTYLHGHLHSVIQKNLNVIS